MVSHDCYPRSRESEKGESLDSLVSQHGLLLQFQDSDWSSLKIEKNKKQKQTTKKQQKPKIDSSQGMEAWAVLWFPHTHTQEHVHAHTGTCHMHTHRNRYTRRSMHIYTHRIVHTQEHTNACMYKYVHVHTGACTCTQVFTK